MATIIDIADAVVAELNGVDAPKFGEPPAGLNAQRAYRPVFALEEMDDLHVTVVPRGVEMTAANRTQVQRDVQIDIAVQKRLSVDDELAQADALMALVEQIAEHFRHKRRAGPQAVWIRTDNEPIFAPEHLDQLRQFNSVLTLTFRVIG
jgi:hypothetical protein